jgi:hypothetical protein
MTMAETGPVIPLLAYALAVTAGANHVTLLVPMLICEVAGIIVYIVEIRERFKHRGGRRR